MLSPATEILNDLTDVTIVTPAASQVLVFDGTQWVNASPSAAGCLLVTEEGIVQITEANDGVGGALSFSSGNVSLLADYAPVLTATPTGVQVAVPLVVAGSVTAASVVTDSLLTGDGTVQVLSGAGVAEGAIPSRIRRCAPGQVDHAATSFVYPFLSSVTTSASSAANTAYAVLSMVRGGQTYTRLGAFITWNSTNPGGAARFAVFSVRSDGRPGNVLLDAGTISYGSSAANLRLDAVVNWTPSVDQLVYVVVATSTAVAQMSGGSGMPHLLTAGFNSGPATAFLWTHNPANAFTANPSVSYGGGPVPVATLRTQ